jgi:glycosyltransferase involved in cell wall biosynthesis
LQSVAQQTLPAHEIVVIDDNSTDDSLAQIEKSGVPVKLLRTSFRNAAAARNAGIEVATGDWLALLDADDVWYSNHLARAAKLLSHTSDEAFISNHDWIGLDEQPIPMPEEFRCKLPAPALELTVEDFFDISKEGFHFGHSTVLYQRDRVLEVGMFDVSQRRRHDIDLWLRVIADRTWTYDTVKSVGYREGTPGSISKDEAECDYYHLRALAKNLPLIDCPSARQYLARQARRAMGIAFVGGTPEHYSLIRETSWPYLSPLIRLSYRIGSLCPLLLRAIMRLRRQITMSPSLVIPDSNIQ